MPTTDTPTPHWHYMAPDPVCGLNATEDPTVALRREWWYEPSNTYVYQVRARPHDAWGPLLGEYEDEGFPAWVGEAVDVDGRQ